MTRRGFTLVEMVVAMLVGTIALIVAFNAIGLMVRGEKATDRESSKALTDSRLMATLLQDVRSSWKVDAVSDKEWRIHRYVGTPGQKLESKEVVWKVVDTKVTRTMDGGRPDEFDYKGLLDPQTLSVKFRLERTTDARFPTSP